MVDDLYINFERYFPTIANQVDEYRVSVVDAPGLVTVRLNDGSYFLYDDFDKTLRKLPRDGYGLTEDECRKEFGFRLRRLLYCKGITQAELSEMTGIPQCSISNYICGKVGPNFYTVDKIAKALGCSLDELSYRY